MKSSTKRLLSLVIVLAMALSMLPMIAFAEAPTTLYVKPNSNWLQSNARFAAYFFGAGETWADCTDADGDGVYEVTVPAGGYTHIIFCRMNPNAAANNWNNKWNQTKDLPLADTSDVKNCYVVAANSWDSGNGQWVGYTPEGGAGETEPTTASPIKYSVAGEASLCGSAWDPSDINNMMTDTDEDGIYTITYENVAAGTYQFKVTDGTWTNSWGKPNSNDNYSLTLDVAAETVEIRFDTATNLIEVIIDGEVPTTPTTESSSAGEATYYVAGTVNGWNEKDAAFVMNEAEGIYTLSFSVAAGDHAIKVTDGTWTNSWGGDGPDGNYVFTTSAEGDVTVTFDGITVTVTGDYIVEKEKEELVINSVHVVGAPGLTGADWDLTANEMSLVEGFYVITFENVAAGTYEFKFAANGTWDINWASGVAMESETVYDAWFNAMGNSSVVIPADGASVTLMLDLTAMDPYTGEGAKCAVVIEGVEIPDPVDTYYVAGSFNEWNCAADGYMMTDNGDDTFSLTLTLTAGSYSLKVTNGTWDQSWGGNGEGGNYDFVVEADGEVTVTFDGETVNVEGGILPEPDPLVINSIHVAGAADLTGFEWDPTANEMLNVNGVYTITFENVAAGTYEFKFVANGNWDINWASGIEITSDETQTAWFKAQGNSSITIAEDGSKVFLAFDSNTMDIYTGEGATMRAVVIGPSVALGATVSGSVVSGAAGDVTIELIADGETVASVTASGKEGTYSIVDVAAGTYTLKVSQLNHVTREYTVTVGEEDLTQDVKIHLIGDIDGNGKVNVGDVSKLNSHLKSTSKITDEYMLLCANVNGGSLNMGDTAALYGHIRSTKPLY